MLNIDDPSHHVLASILLYRPSVSTNNSIPRQIKDLITNFIDWFVHELPDRLVDGAAWLVQGTTAELAVKFMAILIVLICLFVYSSRSSSAKVTTPLNVFMMLIGVLFWGGAALILVAIFFR